MGCLPRAIFGSRTRPNASLARGADSTEHSGVESPIEHRDVTTIMRLLADIQTDVRRIRNLLEDENGEEEAPEDDT